DGKFGARSLVDHELRTARLSWKSQRLPRTLRITDRACLRARCATPALAPASAVPASPKERDVAKDLPEKIEQVVPCSLTSHQRAAYDALLREIQHGLGSSGKNVNAGAQRMKMLTGLLRLRQVCCDLRLVGIDKEETSAKLDLLDELLEEAIDGEHRVLVFSQFVSMLHLIRECLEKLEIPFCYLDGSTKQRQEIVDRFQSDPAIPVFLISLKAG